MFVKICGITRAEDAAAAVSCGAQAVGFVFWPGSPRFIDTHRARAIVSSLPPFVTPVGVFVDQPLEHVREVAALVGLGVVQLHGDESPAFAKGIGRPIMKAIAMGEGFDPRQLIDWPEPVLPLLDVHDPRLRGGTGRTVDWTRAAEIAAGRRVILAGGLKPDNVACAISSVRPYGIDVSSGVEREPGIKDAELMRRLFESVQVAVEDDS